MDAVPQLDTELSTAEAAHLAGVSVPVIWQWKKRGHLVPTSYDAKGRPLYRGIDVLRAEAKTRKHARRQPVPYAAVA